MPKRASAYLRDRIKKARAGFNDACRAIYEQWLQCSKWYSPLLILDEAHHAKNDHTLLAQLFRQSSSEDVALLAGKFQRMLFLTATPFQLGHQELIRVLRSFEAIRWSSPKAPTVLLEQFQAQINRLEAALDDNPSTLEQQTGRIDRIRCKAEICAMPIRVYQPFLAGSADEKMFRVVRDRERWFQIVMGQKFEFDEGTSEAIAARVPLPEGLARELTFDLARWKGKPEPRQEDTPGMVVPADTAVRNRCRGALIGLAIGDALGAAVEFKWAGSFEPVTGYAWTLRFTAKDLWTGRDSETG